jgi:invasion protein IalB
MASGNFLRGPSLRDRCAILALVAAAALPAVASSAAAQENAAWRVECSGDGKTLDCRAVQQMINREDKQIVVQLVARVPADTKAPVLLIQLPLGLNLTEPVQIKIDNGAVEKVPVQTCTAGGCLASLPLKDPMLAALRGGTTLKITVSDTNKRTINIDVPLLGFGLAYDKAK